MQISAPLKLEPVHLKMNAVPDIGHELHFIFPDTEYRIKAVIGLAGSNANADYLLLAAARRNAAITGLALLMRSPVVSTVIALGLS